MNLAKRIINVSNRLPVKITSAENKICYQSSEGGLSTGLSSVFKEYDNIWIGWPGCEVQDNMKRIVVEDLKPQNLHPIFLSQDEINKFYEGFSNETVWPLFHYFPSYTSYNPEHWKSYVAVNRKFADQILAMASPNDIIWIHDYHLMLLPQMLREAMPEVTIGYFQHIPFPSYEVLRALPWKKEILKGLLGADVVGFQTDDDANHFTKAVGAALHIAHHNNRFEIDNRTVKVQGFPISIDYEKYHQLAAHPASKKYAQKLRKVVNSKVIVSIDRLDYSKGILQRLRAYDLFLKTYPEWRQKVTYVHLVVPSRDTVRNYKELKEEMNRLISEINGKYSTLSWQPIRHFYRSFQPNVLSALYKSADLALVTPLVDGMNLVCKEYVASNLCKNGVLVLGEAAGAAKELKEALIINPNDIECFASTINRGLTMPKEEKAARMEAMQKTVRTANIFSWAKSFMASLCRLDEGKAMHLCVPMTAAIKEKITFFYSFAHRRLLFLDYDGTLVPFYDKPADALPDRALIFLLQQLAADSKNDVVVISGRDSATLNKWLGHLPINIVAEHGAWWREAGKDWTISSGLNQEWKHDVQALFKSYSISTPGSFIEDKVFSMVWHYRAAAATYGEAKALALANDLRKIAQAYKLDILEGNKIIEVKCNSVNKGKAAAQFLSRNKYDFIMAIGDDKTDEDLFRAMPDKAISIKVGSDISIATYCQRSHLEVRALLRDLTAITQPLLIGKPTIQLAS